MGLVMRICEIWSWFLGAGNSEIEIRLCYEEREEILSVIFTLMKIDDPEMDKVTLLWEDDDVSQKIIGVKEKCNLEKYENQILSESLDIIDEDNLQDPRLINFLNQVSLNWKFSKVSKVNIKLINKIASFLTTIYQICHAKLVEKPNLENNDVEEPEFYDLSYYIALYSRILNLIQLLINSKEYLMEAINYTGLIHLLLESMLFDNPFISWQSSHIIASFVSRKSNSSIKIVNMNREMLLKNPFHLVKYLEKLVDLCKCHFGEDQKPLKALEFNGAFSIFSHFVVNIDDKYYINENNKAVASAVFADDK
jgi:hypothetical protein